MSDTGYELFIGMRRSGDSGFVCEFKAPITTNGDAGSDAFLFHAGLRFAAGTISHVRAMMDAFSTVRAVMSAAGIWVDGPMDPK